MRKLGKCLPIILLTAVISDVPSVMGLVCTEATKFYCTATKSCETFLDCFNKRKKTAPRCFFSCDNSETCYTRLQECDGVKHCRDGHDEKDCCRWPKISCDGGATCYGSSEKCDGEKKCDDNADENSCNQCTWDEMSCDNGRTCYTVSNRCNGIHDCSDSSDEFSCFSLSNGDDDDSRSNRRGGLSMGEIAGITIGVVAFSLLIAACRYGCRNGCDGTDDNNWNSRYTYSATSQNAVEMQPHSAQPQQFRSSHSYTGGQGQPALATPYSSPTHPGNDSDYSYPDRTYTSFPSAGNLGGHPVPHGNPRPHSPANYPMGPSDITRLTNYGAADSPGPPRGRIPATAPMLPPLPSAHPEPSAPPIGVPSTAEPRADTAPAAPPPTYESLFPQKD